MLLLLQLPSTSFESGSKTKKRRDLAGSAGCHGRKRHSDSGIHSGQGRLLDEYDEDYDIPTGSHDGKQNTIQFAEEARQHSHSPPSEINVNIPR